jgi:hypothetical protein
MDLIRWNFYHICYKKVTYAKSYINKFVLPLYYLVQT